MEDWFTVLGADLWGGKVVGLVCGEEENLQRDVCRSIEGRRRGGEVIRGLVESTLMQSSHGDIEKRIHPSARSR